MAYNRPNQVNPSTKTTPHTADAGFVTTRWTTVLAAGRQSSPLADVALEELCRVYWYPLYAYVRRHGQSKEDAEDLTQAFFERFLQKNYLEGLSSERGRFRAFLLASLKHFLANEWDRAGRQKRGAHATHLSLDWRDADTRYQFDLRDDLSPDKLYDRAWAVALLEHVVGRLHDECIVDGKAEVFAQLKPLLMADKSTISYPQAAAALGISEEAARVAVHRLRRRYRELLREEIAQTLADAAQVDEEMRALFAAFAE
ncbi:MAG: sigma-70 family RNA polymerase sigma factor [Verrucomicrobia bacterium]|nr:sigma-70 family RNA polymerase sigma factor [Verrucomicrobiota bacterium]